MRGQRSRIFSHFSVFLLVFLKTATSLCNPRSSLLGVQCLSRRHSLVLPLLPGTTQYLRLRSGTSLALVVSCSDSSLCYHAISFLTQTKPLFVTGFLPQIFPFEMPSILSVLALFCCFSSWKWTLKGIFICSPCHGDRDYCNLKSDHLGLLRTAEEKMKHMCLSLPKLFLSVC